MLSWDFRSGSRGGVKAGNHENHAENTEISQKEGKTDIEQIKSSIFFPVEYQTLFLREKQLLSNKDRIVSDWDPSTCLFGNRPTPTNMVWQLGQPACTSAERQKFFQETTTHVTMVPSGEFLECSQNDKQIAHYISILPARIWFLGVFSLPTWAAKLQRRIASNMRSNIARNIRCVFPPHLESTLTGSLTCHLGSKLPGLFPCNNVASNIACNIGGVFPPPCGTQTSREPPWGFWN